MAPYEADAQLAFLSNLEAEKGGIAAVITEDSDLVAYGCQAVRISMKFWYDADRGQILSWWLHFDHVSLNLLLFCLFWFALVANRLSLRWTNMVTVKRWCWRMFLIQWAVHLPSKILIRNYSQVSSIWHWSSLICVCFKWKHLCSCVIHKPSSETVTYVHNINYFCISSFCTSHWYWVLFPWYRAIPFFQPKFSFRLAFSLGNMFLLSWG